MFYHLVWKHYQSGDAWSWQTREEFNIDQGKGGTAFNEEEETAWVFEPSVAEKIYNEYIEEFNIKLDRDEWLDRSRGVEISNGNIRSITTLSGKNYRGKVFIDATYEGDLMATSGVSKYRFWLN
ncbi:MAG: FAD-dependent oxidoreductase [Bacteroidales bacterium]